MNGAFVSVFCGNAFPVALKGELRIINLLLGITLACDDDILRPVMANGQEKITVRKRLKDIAILIQDSLCPKGFRIRRDGTGNER